MKKLGLILALTLSTLSAQAGTLERCFNAGKGKTGMIILSDSSVYVDYDLSDRARASKVGGSVFDVTRTANEVSFDSYLDGVGDGSNFRITIGGSVVSFQGLWSTGEIGGAPTSYAVIPCPFVKK